MIKVTPQYISAIPGEFESAVDLCNTTFGSFDHFSVRKGKAQYHFLTLADRSVGIYYALRWFPNGLGCKRALEPLDEIRLYPEI